VAARRAVFEDGDPTLLAAAADYALALRLVGQYTQAWDIDTQARDAANRSTLERNRSTLERNRSALRNSHPATVGCARGMRTDVTSRCTARARAMAMALARVMARPAARCVRAP